MDVIGIGYSVLDYIGLVPGIPPFDGETVTMLDFTKSGGGQVATALVTLARLGATVGYIGILGDDPHGHFMRDEFAHEGVDVSRLIMEPGARSHVSIVLVEQGSAKRAIMTYRGTCRPLELSEGDLDYVKSAEYLHLDGQHAHAAFLAAEEAREAGVKVCLDINRMSTEARQLVDLSDILIVPAGFAVAFTGENNLWVAGRQLLSCQPTTVVITRGPKGCLCFNKDEQLEQPALLVHTVDTTGAGDVFHGAFLFGLLQGWSLKATAGFASAVAALKCRKPGGRSGIPSRSEVEAFLSRGDKP